MTFVLLAAPDRARRAWSLPCARRVVVTVGVNEHSGVVEIARHTHRWRVVGLLLGAAAALGVLALGQRVDALGRVTALAPTVLGAGVLLGTIAGELTARPSVGLRRSAVVETRTLRRGPPARPGLAARDLDRRARRGVVPRSGLGCGR